MLLVNVDIQHNGIPCISFAQQSGGHSTRGQWPCRASGHAGCNGICWLRPLTAFENLPDLIIILFAVLRTIYSINFPSSPPPPYFAPYWINFPFFRLPTPSILHFCARTTCRLVGTLRAHSQQRTLAHLGPVYHHLSIPG